MARAIVKYTFVALLALLSTQTVPPTSRSVATIEFIYRACTEQQEAAPRDGRQTRIEPDGPQPAASYVTLPRPEPSTVVLAQRPPPTHFLFT